jgi:hypothetical protein
MRARDAATTQFPVHEFLRWGGQNLACIVKETSLHAARGFAAIERENLCFIVAGMHMGYRFPVAALSTAYRRAALWLCLSITWIACGCKHGKHMKTTTMAGQVRGPAPPAANTTARAVPEAVTE